MGFIEELIFSGNGPNIYNSKLPWETVNNKVTPFLIILVVSQNYGMNWKFMNKSPNATAVPDRTVRELPMRNDRKRKRSLFLYCV